MKSYFSVLTIAAIVMSVVCHRESGGSLCVRSVFDATTRAIQAGRYCNAASIKAAKATDYCDCLSKREVNVSRRCLDCTQGEADWQACDDALAYLRGLASTECTSSKWYKSPEPQAE
ncbi:hypothetical protein K7432_016437 [Basidiobolus ranarum]|uniref:Uncharacterized protein n=1 Tax=Basidiobolus ranarum TaxID=34480 RepID=A0ABR2VMU7_9FUNG